ncbi:MAG: hypothetical protein U0559_01870 [Anaerolineae bacterium]
MIGGAAADGVTLKAGSTVPHPTEPGVRMNLLDAVKRTLEVELQVNPRLIIW